MRCKPLKNKGFFVFWIEDYTDLWITQENLAIDTQNVVSSIRIITAIGYEKEWPRMRTIGLLTISNIFMTFAWYGHLKFKEVALWKVILISWLIAFFEYCFQVPANRIGSGTFSGAQLKTIQEVITLVVFSVFSVYYLKEEMKWNYLVGFGLIIVAVFFIFKKW